MARRISDLPADINLTGDEQIPAQESGRGVKIGLGSLRDWLSTHLTTNVTLGNVPVASGQDFEASGAIKQGQGVGLFTDGATTKIKASNNSNLTLVQGADSSFEGNMDDFDVDFKALVGDVKRRPLATAEMIANPTDPNANFVSAIAGDQRGFNIKLTPKTDGTGWEWNPETNSGQGEAFNVAVDGSSTYEMEIYRVELLNSGIGTLYRRQPAGKNSRIWYSRVGNRNHQVNFFTSSGDFNGANNYAFTLGSVDLSTFRASANNLTLSFIFSQSDSSSINTSSNIYDYSQNLIASGHTDYHYIDDSLEQTSGRHGVTLAQDGTNLVLYEYEPATAPKFSAYNKDNYRMSFDLDKISLNTTNGSLEITTSNRGGSFNLTFNLYAGGSLVKSQNLSSLGNTETISLNVGEITSITNANYAIEFEFVDNQIDTQAPDKLKVYKQVNTANSNDAGFTIPDDYTFSDIELLGIRNTNLSSSLSRSKLFKLTDTKCMVEVYCEPYFRSTPKISKSGSDVLWVRWIMFF